MIAVGEGCTGDGLTIGAIGTTGLTFPLLVPVVVFVVVCFWQM